MPQQYARMGTPPRMNEDRIAHTVWHLYIDVHLYDLLLLIRGGAGRSGGKSSGECNEITT